MNQKPILGSLNFLIAQTCKAHRGVADRLLADIGLHIGQEMILAHLWRKDGLIQSELVGQLGVQPATVTKMLNRMAQSGLVERRKDSQDQRISRVYLTNQGQAIKKEVEQVWAQLEQYTIQSLNPEDQILLRRLLMQIRDNLYQSEKLSKNTG